MNDPFDSQLRELLRAELRGDECLVPEFDALWDAASARHHRQRTRSFVFKISALAAVIVCGGFLALVLRPETVVPDVQVAMTEVPWRAAVLVTDWQSPTDVLLPQSDLFLFQY